METIERVRVRVLPDGRVSRRDAAAFIGRDPKTLANWATEGKGPRGIRCGGRIYYAFEDLQRFAQGEAA